MIERNIQIEAKNVKPILLDYQLESKQDRLPVVIFSHGLKGFKDWGAWGLMGSAFAKAGYLFIKHNFSHNGGTISQPTDFPDLEAFGHNNYSLECSDLKRVLDWLEESNLPADTDDITLLGHSRGGGIVTITAANDLRVKKLITLAGVANYEERFPKGEDLKKWKQTGVYYVKNGRTGQEMPFYYQFYQDFITNKEELNIINAASRLQIPHLIVHGTNDPTVDVENAYQLHEASHHSQLALIRGGNHVLGASHPWKEPLMPNDLRQAAQCMINFLKREK